MKTNSNTIKALLKSYVQWLNRSYYYNVGEQRVKFVSGQSYGVFFELAIVDLGISESQIINGTPGLLNSFLKSLTKASSFLRRDEKMQSNIVSAFKAYITYKSSINTL